MSRAWRDPSDQEVTSTLALKKLNAWSHGHGSFFWNFKTELEPKWDYIRAVDRGWLPRDAQADLADVASACEEYDEAEAFVCRAKPGASDGEVIAGVDWACRNAAVKLAGCDAPDDASKLAHASRVFDGYYSRYHTAGATCDFGGAAELDDDGPRSTPHPARARDNPPRLLLFRGQLPPGFATHAASRAAHRAAGVAAAARRLLVGAGALAAVGAVALGARRRARACSSRDRAVGECGLRDGLVEPDGDAAADAARAAGGAPVCRSDAWR